MKKLFLGLTLMVSLMACTSQSNKTEKQPIGFDMDGGNQKTPLYGGDTLNVTLFENFIKALNNRDTATIRSLEAIENLKIFTEQGNIVTSADSNIKNLSAWFIANNPKWKLNFAVANSYTNKSGELQEWITSSGTITQTIDGKEVKSNQYFDANIVKGRIQKMYVSERKVAAGE